MRRTIRRTSAAMLCVLLAMIVAACGSDPKKPVGPDVRGLALPDAEAMLRKADVGYTEHATDALFGIVIRENFVVCAETYVSPHEVRLDVAKHGC